MAQRRSDSLTIFTVLSKARRQGATTEQLADLQTRLIFMSGQDPAQASGSARVSVDDMLRAGIRLHPFTLKTTSISLLQP